MAKVAYKESKGVDFDPNENPNSSSTAVLFASSPSRWWRLALVVGVLLCVVGLVCIIVGAVLSAQSKQCPSVKTGSEKSIDPQCEFSAEAKRVDLEGFLKEAQSKYYEMNPDNVAWQPGVTDIREHVKNRYSPYNPDPMVLKRKTDASLELLKKINNMKIDNDALKPREAKAVAQVKHFLKHTFSVPYDENYYAGDWMMGPNLFCWMPICSVQYDLNAFSSATPTTYKDVEDTVEKILDHKKVIDQYRKNVALGITTGMVRTKIDCRAGVDALKQNYKKMSTANDAREILKEWFTANFQKEFYLSKLEDGVDELWKSKHAGKNVAESIKDALVKGFGEPMFNLLNYLDKDHMKHCLPNDEASGLSGLPVDYVFTNGVPDRNNLTTKKLPTGEVLNGTNAYRLMLSYFTTTDLSPEKIYAEGITQLKSFYGQILNITKQYTGIYDNETEAVVAFKKVLNSSRMWHNHGPFPSNESDENAYKKCTSPDTAKKYCPVRWAAIQRWAAYCEEIMGMLYPKITDLFYFTGSKITAPNCPIKMTPHYNPSNGAQFFRKSDKNCAVPTGFGLPFFLKDYGPVFQEWSVTAHEARPGHHTQVQGHVEHFQDNCGGVTKWLDGLTYYTAFTEGWALYSENPVLSHDTDTYKDNLLQKYGMLKWQAWRAVRLIVDTGLHARGMTRTEALKMFEDYAWDTSDFAVKEVTRYQSDPGQATAYMIGRLEIIKMREKAEKTLGSKFNLKDFHFQVLKQGSAPLEFLKNHIDRYIRCVKGDLSKEICQYIVGTNEKTSVSAKSNIAEERPPEPPNYSYI